MYANEWYGRGVAFGLHLSHLLIFLKNNKDQRTMIKNT